MCAYVPWTSTTSCGVWAADERIRSWGRALVQQVNLFSVVPVAVQGWPCTTPPPTPPPLLSPHSRGLTPRDWLSALSGNIGWKWSKSCCWPRASSLWPVDLPEIVREKQVQWMFSVIVSQRCCGLLPGRLSAPSGAELSSDNAEGGHITALHKGCFPSTWLGWCRWWWSRNRSEERWDGCCELPNVPVECTQAC